MSFIVSDSLKDNLDADTFIGGVSKESSIFLKIYIGDSIEVCVEDFTKIIFKKNKLRIKFLCNKDFLESIIRERIKSVDVCGSPYKKFMLREIVNRDNNVLCCTMDILTQEVK